MVLKETYNYEGVEYKIYVKDLTKKEALEYSVLLRAKNFNVRMRKDKTKYALYIKYSQWREANNIKSEIINSKPINSKPIASCNKCKYTPESDDELTEYHGQMLCDDCIEEAEKVVLFGLPTKYSEEDLVDILNSREGWAVSQQLEGILNGQSLNEQNYNALKIIEEFLREKDEEDLADEIGDFLSREEKN